MTMWTGCGLAPAEQQIILSVIGMVGILSVIPVYVYGTVRNPISR